jgi:hypothetical protein
MAARVKLTVLKTEKFVTSDGVTFEDKKEAMGHQRGLDIKRFEHLKTLIVPVSSLLAYNPERFKSCYLVKTESDRELILSYLHSLTTPNAERRIKDMNLPNFILAGTPAMENNSDYIRDTIAIGSTILFNVTDTRETLSKVMQKARG